MSSGVILRAAVPSDVADVLRLIRGLAEYERMLPEATATEDDMQGRVVRAPAPRPRYSCRN